jgi:UrcA family protein
MRASKIAILAAAAALFAGAPTAVAQTYVDEVTVEPPFGPDGPRRLSRAVPIDDLDLTTPEGRHVLNMRVHAAAGDLCRALREDPDAWSPLTRSCREDAKRSARSQMRMAIDQAYARASVAYLDPALRR